MRPRTIRTPKVAIPLTNVPSHATRNAIRIYRKVAHRWIAPDVQVNALCFAERAFADFAPETRETDGLAFEAAYDAAFKYILRECGE